MLQSPDQELTGRKSEWRFAAAGSTALQFPLHRALFAIAGTLALSVGLSLPPTVWAQRNQPAPHIGYVYPAGGCVATSFEVTVGGQYLQKIDQAHLSGEGVQVRVGKYYRPLTQGEYNALRQKLDDKREQLAAEQKAQGNLQPLKLEAIAKAAGVTEEQLKEMEVYRQREADPKRQPNPQIIEEVTLHVEINANAPLGERELRLMDPTGMSNPLWFHVGQWPEALETEPNDRTPERPLRQPLPGVINGQIFPGDVDRFAFPARRGERLVIAASARELIPYLADAVPGWFQAVLSLSDAQGREVAFAGSYYFRQDPVFYYEVPEDGEYILQIHDSLFRGREDFVYRITIGELPFVTGIFPLGGRAGTKVSVELQGWNLAVNRLDVDAFYDHGKPLRWYTVPQAEPLSVRVPLAIDMLPEVLDEEPNDNREQAQAISIPSIINGRIDQPGDVDVFRFEGYGRLVAEVYARRLGSPVDSVLRLLDDQGKELASNDDYEDKGMPLLTHHADSRLLVTLPTTGTYFLQLADAQRQGGRDFIYRLHVRRPRPDFELRVVPSSLIAPPGAHVPITIYALRREGFDDDILLELDGAPPGFTLSGQWVPSGQTKTRLTLTTPAGPLDKPVNLTLQGRSIGRDRRITRPSMPADDMMQAFAYHHLVPARNWTVLVTGRKSNLPAVQFPLERNGRLNVSAGGETRLAVAGAAKDALRDVRLDLSEPPDGLSLQACQPEGNGLAVTLAADPVKVQPGLKGTLVFQAFRERTSTSADGKTTSTQRTPLGVLPAVPFEVVPAKTAPRTPRR